MKQLICSLCICGMPLMVMAQGNDAQPSLNVKAQPAQPVMQTPALQVPAAQAPVLKYGYISYDKLLKSLPDYALAERQMSDLKAQYDAELKRSEEEFNKKYQLFLEGQRDFAPTILQKRQAELQEMMDKNIAFKKDSQRLLEQAHEDAFRPVREKLDAAIKAVGAELGLAFILNTDNNTLPFINEAMGEDITALVQAKLK